MSSFLVISSTKPHFFLIDEKNELEAYIKVEKKFPPLTSVKEEQNFHIQYPRQHSELFFFPGKKCRVQFFIKLSLKANKRLKFCIKI